MTPELAQDFIALSRRYLRDDFLPRLERSVALLTDEQVWWRPHEESNSVGNLLLHLAGNVRQWIVSGVGGAPDTRHRQEEFDERAIIPRAELLEKLRAAVTEADAALARLALADLGEVRRIQGREVGVLEAVYHVVEHFSMHTGQIILLTKMFTGRGLDFYAVRDGVATKTWPAPPDAE